MITTSNQETNRTCLVRGLSFPAPAKAISSGRSTLFTINIMHLRLLHEVNEFQESCRQASLVTLYSNLLNTYFIKWRMRVATGSDFVRFLSHNACLTDESIVVVGNVTDAQAAQVIEGRRVDVISPGWGFMKDAVAEADIVARCRALNPGVIFIAVGAPQSEKLTLRLHQAVLRAPSILCCGAAFEFDSGCRSGLPSLPDGLAGMVWRLLSNPRRIAKRYFFSARVSSSRS